MMHRQETVECLKKFNARRKLKVRRLAMLCGSIHARTIHPATSPSPLWTLHAGYDDFVL